MAATPVSVLFRDEAERPGYLAPSATLEGAAWTRLGVAEISPQWVVTGSVARGSRLCFGEDHHDEAIYIENGGVEVDGRACEAGGAVVVEAGAAPEVVFREPSRIVHFGRSDATSEVRAGAPAVHVVAAEGMFGPAGDPATPSRLTFFANGSCPGCDLVLFRLVGEAGHRQGSHRHTADEVIHVLEGGVQVGRDRIGSGMAIAIPANRLYGFRTTEPWSYLNYRPTPSDTFLPNGELVRR